MTNETLARKILNGEIDRMRMLLEPALSLDAPLNDEPDVLLMDVTSDPASENFQESMAEQDYYDGLHALLERAMDRLSPDLKELLILKYYQEKSNEQIAEITGLPLHRVRERIQYARKRIREGRDARAILRYVQD